VHELVETDLPCTIKTESAQEPIPVEHRRPARSWSMKFLHSEQFENDHRDKTGTSRAHGRQDRTYSRRCSSVSWPTVSKAAEGRATSKQRGHHRRPLGECPTEPSGPLFPSSDWRGRLTAGRASSRQHRGNQVPGALRVSPASSRAPTGSISAGTTCSQLDPDPVSSAEDCRHGALEQRPVEEFNQERRLHVTVLPQQTGWHRVRRTLHVRQPAHGGDDVVDG
jgi:hypothetical protein